MFRRKRKLRHSPTTVLFYSEAERKKSSFSFTVISKQKWYYFEEST